MSAMELNERSLLSWLGGSLEPEQAPAPPPPQQPYAPPSMPAPFAGHAAQPSGIIMASSLPQWLQPNHAMGAPQGGARVEACELVKPAEKDPYADLLDRLPDLMPNAAPDTLPGYIDASRSDRQEASAEHHRRLRQHGGMAPDSGGRVTVLAFGSKG